MMTKLELVAEIGPSQLDIVLIYLNGLLSPVELEGLIGKRKSVIVSKFTEEIVK